MRNQADLDSSSTPNHLNLTRTDIQEEEHVDKKGGPMVMCKCNKSIMILEGKSYFLVFTLKNFLVE